jgi:hypothetical protein
MQPVLKIMWRRSSMEPMKPKQNHKAIREQSEAILIAKLLEVGYGILTPSGDTVGTTL